MAAIQAIRLTRGIVAIRRAQIWAMRRARGVLAFHPLEDF